MSRAINNGSSTHVRYGHSCRPRDLDVQCPSCGHRALANKVSERNESTLIGDMSPGWNVADWTISCLSCAYRAHDVAYDHLPKLFWDFTVGDIGVWAWNRDHLAFLAKYLSGDRTSDDPYAWLGTYVPGDWQRIGRRIARVMRDRLVSNREHPLRVSGDIVNTPRSGK